MATLAGPNDRTSDTDNSVHDRGVKKGTLLGSPIGGGQMCGHWSQVQWGGSDPAPLKHWNSALPRKIQQLIKLPPHLLSLKQRVTLV